MKIGRIFNLYHQPLKACLQADTAWLGSYGEIILFSIDNLIQKKKNIKHTKPTTT